MSKNRRDGSKKSFADRDKSRRENRSGGGRGDRRGSSGGSNYAQKSYKAALERAFADGKVEEFAAKLTKAAAPPSIEIPKVPTPSKASDQAATAKPTKPTKPKPPSAEDIARAERRKLCDKIKQAEGSREVAGAVDKYLAKFETLPNDYEVLEKALAHPKSPVVIQVLSQLIEQIDASKPRRSRSLALQLEILEDTSDDADVRDLAVQARKKL